MTGGGGAIFAVPLLLYGLGLPLRQAVSVSLLTVGLTAWLGALLQWRQVLWRAGLILGIGGIAGAPLGAWLGRGLPEAWILLLFGGLMLFMGARMWRGAVSQEVPLSFLACAREPGGQLIFHWGCAVKLVGAGAAAGVLAGLFGVGGGFLLAPALLLTTGMPMQRILATSLVGIGLVSASALAANTAALWEVQSAVAVWFTAGAMVGVGLGGLAKSKLPDVALKRVFAVAMMAMAIWILIRSGPGACFLIFGPCARL